MSREKTNKDITKKYGEVTLDASFYMENPKEIISVSPSMDAALGGGIPKGSWLNVAGKEKTGKTTWVWAFIKRCQEAGMNIYYASVENRLKQMNLRMEGLDLKSITVVQSTKEKLLTGDEQLNLANDVLHTLPNTLFVIDSVSALCTGAETENEITNNSRPTGPKLLAQFCRKNKDVIPIMNSIVLSIHHLAANITGFGSPWKEDGGAKLQYQSDTKLRVKNLVPKFTEDQNGIIKGLHIEWNIPWAANAAPAKDIDNYINFQTGFDISRELVDVGHQVGLIEQPSKGWYEYQDKRYHGSKQLAKYFDENIDIRDSLYKEIKDI